MDHHQGYLVHWFREIRSHGFFLSKYIKAMSLWGNSVYGYLQVFTPGVEAGQLCIFLKLANVGDGEAIEEVHQGDHHHQDEEDQEGEGGRGQCWVSIDGKVGELELTDEHGRHLDKAEPGSVEERVFFFFRLVNVGTVIAVLFNNLVLIFPDLKFVATVTTGGRVNFFQLCKYFQKNNAFLCKIGVEIWNSLNY